MAPVDLLIGPLIQCMEAATLGMPFEVWKTRMGSNRTEGTLEAFKNIYRKGGPKAFWAGTGPKMIESASKVRHLSERRENVSQKRAKTSTDFFSTTTPAPDAFFTPYRL
jgi:hypothetical protein